MSTMNDFPGQVLSEIQARGVTPRSRAYFVIRYILLWLLAIASVVLGAIAFSVADYVYVDNEGIRPNELLSSPFGALFLKLPFIWLGMLTLFAVLAYVGFRNTKTGYRHQPLLTVIAVIAVTIALGLSLNLFDFGQAVHDYFLGHTTFYDALIRSNDDWQ